MNDNTKKLYEVSFLAKDESGAAAVVQHLTRFSAENIKQNEIKKIKLTYPIRKETSAFLCSINCELPMDSVAKVSDSVKLDKNILRMLIVEPQETSGAVIEPISGRASREPEKVTRIKPTKRENADSEGISNKLLEEKLEEILQ